MGGGVLGGVLQGQGLDGGPLLPVVLQLPQPAEDDDAAVEGGVLQGRHLVLGHHTEGGLGLPAQGVQLVAAFGAVEVQLPLVVQVAQGHGVGVPVIPGEGQHPAAALFQNSLALGLGQGLALPAHFSKHFPSLLFFSMLL